MLDINFIKDNQKIQKVMELELILMGMVLEKLNQWVVKTKVRDILKVYYTPVEISRHNRQFTPHKNQLIY